MPVIIATDIDFRSLPACIRTVVAPVLERGRVADDVDDVRALPRGGSPQGSIRHCNSIRSAGSRTVQVTIRPSVNPRVLPRRRLLHSNRTFPLPKSLQPPPPEQAARKIEKVLLEGWSSRLVYHAEHYSLFIAALQARLGPPDDMMQRLGAIDALSSGALALIWAGRAEQAMVPRQLLPDPCRAPTDAAAQFPPAHARVCSSAPLWCRSFAGVNVDLATLEPLETVRAAAVGDPGAAAIARLLCFSRTLTTVELGGAQRPAWARSSDCRGRCAGVDAFSRTVLCAHLNEMPATGNNLHDEGAVALADSLRTSRVIRALHVNNNAISEAGGSALADALKAHPSLATFDVGGAQRLVSQINSLTRCFRCHCGLSDCYRGRAKQRSSRPPRRQPALCRRRRCRPSCCGWQQSPAAAHRWMCEIFNPDAQTRARAGAEHGSCFGSFG